MEPNLFKKTEFAAYSKTVLPKPGDIYISNQALNDAVKVSLMLNQPLLLTGEPGTGKTTLGRKIARELHKLSDGAFAAEPLFFSTKSSSQAHELFYTYDAIAHFQQANLAKQNTENAKHQASDYIKLQALGLAILSGNRDQIKEETNLLAQLPVTADGKTPDSYVIVIDEIDKATRDFPNDLLYEIENYAFSIKEMGNKEYIKSPNARIFIVLTSNSEKTLPEAFLRRCIFHHIEYPDDKTLKEILTAYRISYNADIPIDGAFISSCIHHFNIIREKCTDKKPSTAELISWVRFLASKEFSFEEPNFDILQNSLSVIIKSRHDLRLIKNSELLLKLQNGG